MMASDDTEDIRLVCPQSLDDDSLTGYHDCDRHIQGKACLIVDAENARLENVGLKNSTPVPE